MVVTPFPLTDLGDGCCTINANLAGLPGSPSMIDTGSDGNGWLTPALYRQWTNQAASASEKVYSPDGTLGGELYHDLDLRQLDEATLTNDDHLKYNGIGLRALAQNLVTLDFPRHTLYLKHTAEWPLATREMMTALKSAGNSTMKTLMHLVRKGQLPGASKTDHGKTIAFHFHHDDTPYLDNATWDLLKNGDPSNYHYTFTRAAKHAPWQLQKAWRTDPTGRLLQTYPVPR